MRHETDRIAISIRETALLSVPSSGRVSAACAASSTSAIYLVSCGVFGVYIWGGSVAAAMLTGFSFSACGTSFSTFSKPSRRR